MIRSTSLVVAILLSPLIAARVPTTEVVSNTVFGYEVEVDIVYAKGKIAPNGVEVLRDLKLDVYKPALAEKNDESPAVILVHGGAYHRGGRRQPPFRESGAVHSRMEDYARLLAPLGYVCFVIEYRLAPEYPVPEQQPGADNLLPLETIITPSGLERVNFAREAMGLPQLAKDEGIVVWNAAMAGAEDTAKAVNFVRENARRFGIDPERIAVGGHSAGGGNTLNAAIGLQAPIAAIFPLSPPGSLYDLNKVHSLQSLPPTLILMSQYDLHPIFEHVPYTLTKLREAGSYVQLAWVPGFPHFYPTGAASLGDDGSRMSVGERVKMFLDTHLRDQSP